MNDLQAQRWFVRVMSRRRQLNGLITQLHFGDAQGAKDLPPIRPRQNSQRGRIAKSDAHNLWECLKDREKEVLLFAKLPHVAFTNDRAERDLRMSKVKQKVSGCFRTFLYAETYCPIYSYLQTMANRGYGPLVAVQMALFGEIYAQTGE